MIFQSIFISFSRARAPRLATRLLARIAAAAMLIALWLPGAAFGLPGATGQQATEFTIYKPGTNEVMGHAKYSVKTQGEYEIVTGDYRYVTGSYDIEHDKLAVSPKARMLALIKYDHTFYRPDGSSDHATTADLQSGVASCTWDSNGKANTETKTLPFPSDTYAGASVILALQSYLADANDVVELHAFNCVPGPKIFAVKASPRGITPWQYRAGPVMQVDAKPDFGWLNVVIAPFVPDLHLWFEPAQDWEFDGAQFTRYYKGPELVLVRMPGGSTRLPELSAIKPPELSKARPTPTPSP
jgi:hypothetical protein